MTAHPFGAAARPRRTVRRGVALVLALLLPVIGTGATATATAADTPVMTQPDTVAGLSQSRDIAAVAPALAQKVDAQNRTAADIERIGKEVVAEAERIAKEAAEVRSAQTALDAKTAAVNQETDSHNEHARTLSGKIDAHNAAPPPRDQAAAVSRYNAEADQLEAEQGQVKAEEAKIQGEQAEIRQEEAQLNSRGAQLNAASKANEAKAADGKAKTQQLQLQTQQLLQEMAQLLESLAAAPPNPAAAMDQGGDAPAPLERNDEARGLEADTADSPYRQPQTSAMKQYAQQAGAPVDTRPGTAYLTPEAVGRLSAAQAATLTSPSVTYDGLVRKPNGHYTALRVQAPAAAPAPATAPAPAPNVFESGGLVAYRNGEQLLIDGITTVQEAPVSSEPEPIPGPRPGDSGAADERRDHDCLRGGEGWVDMGDIDAGHGGRATGAEACLNSAYLADHKGTRTDVEKEAPPGYMWAKRYAGWLELDSSQAINACHILAGQLSGSGTDRRNISTCSRSANTYVKQSQFGPIPENMNSWEDKARHAVDNGQIVHYKVVPNYAGDRTVPVAYEISAQGTYPDGRPGLRFDTVVPNMILSPSKGWRNLGLVTHTETDQPVPIGSEP
ncbi:DNA/RNA non-specific endonuclease [Kitasatospora sp. NPDC097691]|uniref:DNA/RNA non-specific endonuclease n=1 Tax=Kitasatospora sp. NPDC097691 TaxID=3157231 RepID=UPI0033170DAF